MITYLINTLLCAAVMFLIYILFLEREKMHRFNRFYLLFSIVFSLTVSFITINVPTKVVTVNELIAPVYLPAIISTGTDLQQTQTTVPVEESFPWLNLILGFYIAGTAFFLIRFVRNLFMLLFKAASNKSTEYHGATLVLENNLPVPHSFMNYIFIDREKFEQGKIEKEILQHELTHVNQKHSIDILLVELIMVFAWVNPLLFLFRKAIMLNHEYLADDAVVNTFNDTESYRLLLFNKVSQTNNLVLSSPFNYLTTKKRLIMMTKNTSRKVAILKQIALIPLIAAIGFLLSTRVNAQDNKKQPSTQEQILSAKTDAPQSVIDAYHALIEKCKIKLTPRQEKIEESFNKTAEKSKIQSPWFMMIDDQFKIDKPDRDRLEQLYFQMSKRQQSHERVAFKTKPALRDKIVPTKEQLELWKNPKIYGLFIEGKRVKNTVLNQHTNTDFYYYHLYTLEKESLLKNNYKIEVQLFTKRQFDRDITATLAMRNKTPYKYDLVYQTYSKTALAEIDAKKE